jgi:hypothetical protein
MAQWLRDVSVGEWYAAGGEPFEIVGIDVKTEVVLIQHFDGALEEVEFDSWEELNARQCAPPEDYSGALDLERADYGLDLEDDHRYGKDNPLDFLDMPSGRGFDDY